METRPFWREKQILVTGGHGFVGSAVVRAILALGVPEDRISLPRRLTCDLRNAESCVDAVRGCSIVIHLAAATGDFAYSGAHPASQYRDCTLINLNMLEAARCEGVGKFVGVGNLHAYPELLTERLREELLQSGAVASSHLGLGTSKRDLVSMAQMYHREYGMQVVNVLAANAYGPGDRYEPNGAHVIPATIMKCLRDEDLNVWGDGTPTRDFLFVDDVARGILLAAESLPAPDFVNIASGREISIFELVHLIARLTGFRREVRFDRTKPAGSLRRVADAARAARLGFSPQVQLEDGLRRTIEWFRATHAVPARQ